MCGAEVIPEMPVGFVSSVGHGRWMLLCFNQKENHFESKKTADEIFELYMLRKVKLILGSTAECLCLHVMTWHAAVDFNHVLEIVAQRNQKYKNAWVVAQHQINK